MKDIAKLEANVAKMVDRALAERIEAAGERMDLTPGERVAWIAAVIGLRAGLITECTTQVARRLEAPEAPTLVAQ